MKKSIHFITCLASAITITVSAAAQTDRIAVAQAENPTLPARFNLHFQTTYIYQYKPAFHADYTGSNSLIPVEEKENSLTATLYLGLRLWKGAEVYINPELAGGSGLSGAFGLGASTNGETFRVGNPEPTLYLARGYFGQTFKLGSDTEMVDEGPNELGSIKPVNYIRLLAGKLCLADIFDINAYANSPRTQFLNWCLMNNGAWDYAANTRGYTYAIAAIAQYKSWTYTAALGTLPKVANGPDLNTDLSEAYSLNAEVHKAYKLKGRSGNARLLVFHNNCNMGNYDQATHDITRDIVANRRFGRTKTGLGFNADQELSKTAGVFLRTGWNDGINETWAYTEVDRTLTAGLSLNGASWKRTNDNLSLALLANGLSPDHRAYLKAGGKGFELGDGNLNYANEAGVEIFYSCKPVAKLDIWLSADYQFILNPGYNRDRGPVNVFSFRLHAEL